LGRKDAEPFPDQSLLDDWIARNWELVERYQPQLVYFDWWMIHHAFESPLQWFATYYNRGVRW
jgi:alpha-L-fucosidase